MCFVSFHGEGSEGSGSIYFESFHGKKSGGV